MELLQKNIIKEYKNIEIKVNELIYENTININKKMGYPFIFKNNNKTYLYYRYDSKEDVLLTDEIIKNQAFIIEFLNDFKVVLRKSGTGTSGETLRIYLSGFKKYDSNIVGIDSKVYLQNLFLKLKNIMGIIIDYSNIV